MTKFKISFCTVVMDRVVHLRQTLQRNLSSTENEDEVEFLILDYNSSDDVELYIKSHFCQYIATGRIVFFRTDQPTYFDRCHSRNLAFKLASGEIICNLDADNYVPKGLVGFIRAVFETSPRLFLTYIHPKLNTIPDVMGRVALLYSDFLRVRGYDESMQGYGFEDYDFVNRLEASGLKRMTMPIEFARAIPHSQSDRVSNEYLLKNLHGLYFFRQTPAQTTILFLLRDSLYQLGVLIDNRIYKVYQNTTSNAEPHGHTGYTLLTEYGSNGNWWQDGMRLSFQHKAGVELSPLFFNDDCLCKEEPHGNTSFREITDSALITNTVMLYSQLFNKSKMARNSILDSTEVNKEGFGRGAVFCNFEKVTSREIF